MNIDLKNLNINYDEVLRYLEYNGQNLSEGLKETINQCINITKNKINPRYILRVYPIERKITINTKGNEVFIVKIKGSNVELESKDIFNLLEGCSECALIATTLGVEIEREIRKNTYSDLTKGIIIDSCATTAIEEVCDCIENNIKEDLLKKGKYITSRYSPGYGDLPIEANAHIINLLGTQNRIGLTITENNIMIPRKSVIAIIGISEAKKINNKKSCLSCDKYHDCKYRKEVEDCGN